MALPQSPAAPKKGTASKTTAKKRSTRTSSASSSAPAARTSAKGASAKGASAKGASAKKGRSVRQSTKTVAASRRGQTTPTPERYREIQQALADKGYLKSEPNGVWDAESTDALSRFQADQKLTPTGKITSSSLIDLGLGPKNENDSPRTPAGAAPAAIDPPPAPVEQLPGSKPQN